MKPYRLLSHADHMKLLQLLEGTLSLKEIASVMDMQLASLKSKIVVLRRKGWNIRKRSRVKVPGPVDLVENHCRRIWV